MNTQATQHERRRQERRSSTPGVHGSGSGAQPMHKASYGRFAGMVAASTALGFGAMYLNIYQPDHLYFSWNRLFMAMIMGGIMTAVMMLFMWGMYANTRANRAVLGIAAALFLSGLALARTQASIADIDWMKSMIPHHSIAILTSERAGISDPRVQELAAQIIESQRREIAEMKVLLQELEAQ
jgi:uncharacterized protein (DUF305 family)